MQIAISVGEPAGIGPDLCVMLAQSQDCSNLLLFADPELLLSRAKLLGLPLTVSEVSGHAPPPATRARRAHLNVLPHRLQNPAKAGQLDVANVDYVLGCLDSAIAACLAGHCQALLTGPLHKGIINAAGQVFSGHTEYLAERCQSAQPVMLLQSPQLRVALVTTHLPLADVPAAITPQRLQQVIQVLNQDLARYLGRPVTIFVSGLNPHAGENGYLGREEIDVIEPVLQSLRAQGLNLVGPLSADTMFSQDNLQRADAFLCMFHDQGLPVLKYQGFGNAVNITLGLPFVRCSVDHGTALELAGRGNIDSGSMEYALASAIALASPVHG